MKYVYFAQCDFGGPIKIGCSHTPLLRVQVQQLMLPFTLVTIGQVTGSHYIERFLHAWFRPQQIRGEWFQPTPELWRAAFEARTTGNIHFLPPDLPHGYTINTPTDVTRRHLPLGISQENLAAAMGVAAANVRQIEKAEITNNLNYIAALSVLLIRAGHRCDLLDIPWRAPIRAVAEAAAQKKARAA